MRRKHRHAFTLIEALATIAIISVVIAVAIPFVGNYVAKAKQTADRQTLAVLNDALTRYKTQGGALTALTSGASMGNVLNLMREPITWNGLSHQILRQGETFPARSISASGNGRDFRFTGFASYQAEAIGNSQVGGGSEMPYGEGVGYMSNQNDAGGYNVYVECSSDWVVFRSSEGNDVFVASNGDDYYENLPQSNSYTFWACAADGDSTPAGVLESLDCAASELTTLDVSGLTSLEWLYCNANQLTTLDVSGLASLREISCSDNQINTLDFSGLTLLHYFYCSGNQLTTLDVSGLTSLTYFNCGGNQLTTLHIGGLDSLLTLVCGGNQLLALDISSMPLLHELHCYDNQLDAMALNQIYTDSKNGAGGGDSIFVSGNPGISSHDPTIATSKGWMVITAPQ